MGSPVPAGAAARLKITEIFLSVQGESSSVGWPTVFVRLTGCPLRCHYCDTTYAFHGGKWMELAEIVDAVAALGARHVCVTGGEPLAQKNCLPLLSQLCDIGLDVSLETSGALDITPVDPRVRRIVDIKTPASGEEARNLWPNIAALRPHDEIKFVICNRADYEWARARTAELELPRRCAVLFSPTQDQLAPAELVQWILDDRLPVRFQLQLHKVLWGNSPGR